MRGLGVFYCERVRSEGGGRTVAKGDWDAGPVWLSTWKGTSTRAKEARERGLAAGWTAGDVGLRRSCAGMLVSSPSSLFFKQKRREKSAGSLDRVVSKMKYFRIASIMEN